MSIKDYYIGSEMSVINCDKFAHLFIAPETLVEDMELLEHKWWDYRTMHPAKATMYFYHLHNKIAEGYITRYFGVKAGMAHKRFAAIKDLRRQTVNTVRAIWKARMTADALGIPYDVYLHTVFKHFYANYQMYATTKVRDQQMPYPNQLVSDAIIRNVENEWRDERKARFRMPESDLILHKDVWFRPEMEAALRVDMGMSHYPEFFLDQAIDAGAIFQPN